MEPSDQELLRSACRGDAAAFCALVNSHGPGLYRLAVTLVNNQADAEDVVQETLAGALRGLTGFRGECSVRTWLTRILVRQAAMHRRTRDRARQAIRLRPIASERPPASRASDTRADLAAAIGALSPEHREVIVLRELQRLSYDEIAHVLDVPQGTVESRLFRARRELAGLLRDYVD